MKRPPPRGTRRPTNSLAQIGPGGHNRSLTELPAMSSNRSRGVVDTGTSYSYWLGNAESRVMIDE
jgi:hypothetical protein